MWFLLGEQELSPAPTAPASGHRGANLRVTQGRAACKRAQTPLGAKHDSPTHGERPVDRPSQAVPEQVAKGTTKAGPLMAALM